MLLSRGSAEPGLAVLYRLGVALLDLDTRRALLLRGDSGIFRVPRPCTERER
jgi:hypothetical protein